MKNSRNQLILLGFLCQGLSWDDYWLPLANAGLWVLCLTLPKRPIRFGPWAEIGFLAGGALFGYFLGSIPGHSVHFFVGHGLTFLQAARLMSRLNRREQIFSIFAACVQVGVGCTVVLDFRFVLLLLAALILIPRAMMETEAEAFSPASIPMSPHPGTMSYAAVLGAAVLAFLLLPRGFLGAPMPSQSGGRDLEGALDSELELARSGKEQGNRIFLQVEGNRIGYLRFFTLVDFDGKKWFTEKKAAFKRKVVSEDKSRLDSGWKRRVRVKQIGALGKVLPVDGRVAHLQGRFFRGAYQNAHDGVECENLWNTRNNIYEYWIEPDPPVDRMTPLQVRKFTLHPEPTPRLQQWLDRLLAGKTDPEEQAQILQKYFRDEFEYALGGPELNSEKPVDDFIFNQRRGHCERFAGTLGLLLRMRGIPARVVLGYVPQQRNWISGWSNVRSQDAHAWTEAYIPGRGWRIFDATPPGALDRRPSPVRDLFDALDVAWYLHVINFDAGRQREFLAGSMRAAGRGAAWTRAHQSWLWSVGILLLIGAALWMQPELWLRLKQLSAVKPRTCASAAASNYYGRMLRILGSKGLEKKPEQTPFEFLDQVRAHSPSWTPEAETVTRLFCASRYGAVLFGPEEEARVEAALRSIRDASDKFQKL